MKRKEKMRGAFLKVAQKEKICFLFLTFLKYRRGKENSLEVRYHRKALLGIICRDILTKFVIK